MEKLFDSCQKYKVQAIFMLRDNENAIISP